MTLTPAQTQFLRENIHGFDPLKWSVTPAGAAGSDRRFVRIQKIGDAQPSFILILWNSRDEDWPRFLDIEKELGDKIPFLPKILAHDAKHGLILEEDLGTMTLKQFCRERPNQIEQMYTSVINALIQWQSMEIIAGAVIASRSMDLEIFLWESRYFSVQCVTEFFGCDSLIDAAWEKEREKIALEASALPKVCIHRDFQSENILVQNGAIRFVDFQGARLGPAGYDAASLLFDPYIPQLEGEIGKRLFDYYLSKKATGISAEALYLCGLQRLMQALGAYGNLSIHKGKERYRQFIPIAVERCVGIAEKLPRFPQLLKILTACRNKIE
jgi:N-acetylmuramate 1-kinase